MSAPQYNDVDKSLLSIYPEGEMKEFHKWMMPSDRGDSYFWVPFHGDRLIEVLKQIEELEDAILKRQKTQNKAKHAPAEKKRRLETLGERNLESPVLIGLDLSPVKMNEEMLRTIEEEGTADNPITFQLHSQQSICSAWLQFRESPPVEDTSLDKWLRRAMLPVEIVVRTKEASNMKLNSQRNMDRVQRHVEKVRADYQEGVTVLGDTIRPLIGKVDQIPSKEGDYKVHEWRIENEVEAITSITDHTLVASLSPKFPARQAIANSVVYGGYPVGIICNEIDMTQREYPFLPGEYDPNYPDVQRMRQCYHNHKVETLHFTDEGEQFSILTEQSLGRTGASQSPPESQPVKN
ncbi:hypothetical protein BDV96DRAFT_632013 [Lophiotrema nucula]|uniref:Uncharacterized protein n=1 Tax=Lophiotrema nucula TaxID=690887 RepID=A0A6A5Z7X4_9PLEO|nr:hypothetical protein BDV96DRAFT_632013 [Lophiotrema nucula]